MAATVLVVPRQNRVTPLSELIATPARGLVYGNRGCLHDEAGRIRRRYNGKRWISCRLRFKDWHRAALMRPGQFTELFFLDEATAFAAVHRPCALCRRADYARFMTLWQDVHPHIRAQADPVDAQLHEERIDVRTRTQRHHAALFDDLPDGAFVLHDGEPHLVRGVQLHRWTPAGYLEPVRRPHDEVACVITPPSMVAILAAGWAPVVPLLHPSAAGADAPSRRSDAGRRSAG